MGKRLLKDNSKRHAVSGATKRIHITGTPRSGTTLFVTLMLACFEIDGGVTDERRLWRTPPKNCRVVLTKFPGETDFATQMLSFDWDLHVIFLVRDPRDVVVSENHRAPGRYMTNFRVWRDDLHAAIPYFGHKRFHVVTYDELVADPDGVQARLAEDMPFLKVLRPFSRYLECGDQHGGEWLTAMPLNLRPVDKDRMGRWREFLPRIKGQMIIHGDITDDLMMMGFETDRSWASALDNVLPDLRSSATPERADFGRRVTRRWRNVLGAFLYLARRYLGIELSDTGETPQESMPRPGVANENSSFSRRADLPKSGTTEQLR